MAVERSPEDVFTDRRSKTRRPAGELLEVGRVLTRSADGVRFSVEGVVTRGGSNGYVLRQVEGFGSSEVYGVRHLEREFAVKAAVPMPPTERAGFDGLGRANAAAARRDAETSGWQGFADAHDAAVAAVHAEDQ